MIVVVIVRNLINYVENTHFRCFLSIGDTLDVQLNALEFKVLRRRRQFGKCVELRLVAPVSLIGGAVFFFLGLLISIFFENNLQILNIIKGKFLL